MCLVVSGNVVHRYGPFSFHYILENLSQLVAEPVVSLQHLVTN